LQDFPYACRKAGEGHDPFLRELLIGFGGTGYVVLYRIDEDTVTVAAVRHQREDDYC
jgi:plasmid stabilization system protein ParE